ncbi:MAG TPA: hypothetical protein PK514_11195 [Spirochaetota bacterium]|nr:hypothetical protein [Spirochaetota bacterium]
MDEKRIFSQRRGGAKGRKERIDKILIYRDIHDRQDDEKYYLILNIQYIPVKHAG